MITPYTHHHQANHQAIQADKLRATEPNFFYGGHSQGNTRGQNRLPMLGGGKASGNKSPSQENKSLFRKIKRSCQPGGYSFSVATPRRGYGGTGSGPVKLTRDIERSALAATSPVQKLPDLTTEQKGKGF